MKTRTLDTSATTMRPSSLAALPCLLLAGIACGSVASAQSFPVAGVVLNDVTQAPVPDVELTLSPSPANDGPIARTTSDEQGRFRFESVLQGKYYFSGKRAGYGTQLLNQREGFSTLVVTGPNVDNTTLVFHLRPRSGISGTVIDEDNEPVRHAEVSLYRKHVQNGVAGTHVQFGATTAETGTFRFANLEPGSYYIAVRATPWYAQQAGRRMRGQIYPDGTVDEIADSPRSPLEVAYPLTWFGNTTDAAGATPILLAAGENPRIAINLRPVPALRLKVIAPPGTDPNGGRSVQLMMEGPDGTNMNVNGMQSVSAPGSVLVSGLAPGRYRVQLMEFNPKGGPNVTYVQSVDLTGDQTVAMQGQPRGVISGTISSDEPLAEPAYISLRGLHGGQFGSLIERKPETQAGGYQGTLRFDGESIPDGRYEVLVQSQGAVSGSGMTIASLAVNGTPASSHVISLTGADTQLTVRVIHGKLAQIEGFVVKDDHPTPGMAVFVVPDDVELREASTRRDLTDSDGSFTLQGVFPGRYTAFALEDGFDLEYANPEIVKPYLAQGVPVSVAPGASLQLKLPVLPH
jgi:protocatechuate 3,4-dioxygenase beta subunit